MTCLADSPRSSGKRQVSSPTWRTQSRASWRVLEIWDSKAQSDAFFVKVVVPHLPPGCIPSALTKSCIASWARWAEKRRERAQSQLSASRASAAPRLLPDWLAPPNPMFVGRVLIDAADRASLDSCIAAKSANRRYVDPRALSCSSEGHAVQHWLGQRRGASACFRLDVWVGSSAPALLRRTIGMRCAPGIYTMSAASDVISTSASEVRT